MGAYVPHRRLPGFVLGILLSTALINRYHVPSLMNLRSHRSVVSLYAVLRLTSVMVSQVPLHGFCALLMAKNIEGMESIDLFMVDSATVNCTK